MEVDVEHTVLHVLVDEPLTETLSPPETCGSAVLDGHLPPDAPLATHRPPPVSRAPPAARSDPRPTMSLAEVHDQTHRLPNLGEGRGLEKPRSGGSVPHTA